MESMEKQASTGMGAPMGNRIAAYRKAKGLTQEQLGEAVGVSGQAVSKWENGGIPDTMLLPGIAVTLGVTVDCLFGVEKSVRDMSEADFEQLVFDYCRERGFDFDRLFRLVWCMHTAVWGEEVEFVPLREVIDKHAGNEQITSQVIRDEGTTYLSLIKGFPFFCAVKDDPGISERLLAETDFGAFFSILADDDGRRAVMFTQTATESSQYTAEAMARKMGIDTAKFNELLPRLVKYGLLHEDSLTLDDRQIKVYHMWSNPEIRPLLMMAYQFIHARQCYYNFTCNRAKAYFERVD